LHFYEKILKYFLEQGVGLRMKAYGGYSSASESGGEHPTNAYCTILWLFFTRGWHIGCLL
jgi:hypothetical protein